VPDGVVMDMLRKPVVAAAQAGGYVLDGFPRTVEQARASFPTAHALGVEVQVAVHLDVTRAELVRRLLARRRGSEDTEAVIERRLQVYLDKTVPLPRSQCRQRATHPIVLVTCVQTDPQAATSTISAVCQLPP
jgi:adenylate kinase